MRSLMYSCRRVAELTSKSMESPLSAYDRVQLAAHRAMCARCREFGKQVRFLRKAARSATTRLDADE